MTTTEHSSRIDHAPGSEAFLKTRCENCPSWVSHWCKHHNSLTAGTRMMKRFIPIISLLISVAVPNGIVLKTRIANSRLNSSRVDQYSAVENKLEHLFDNHNLTMDHEYLLLVKGINQTTQPPYSKPWIANNRPTAEGFRRRQAAQPGDSPGTPTLQVDNARSSS